MSVIIVSKVEAVAHGGRAVRCRRPGCERLLVSIGRGRPAEFCGTPCREADKLLRRLESHVERCAAEATDAASLDALRSAVASMMNSALNPARARLARTARNARTVADVPTVAETPALAAVASFGDR